MAAVFNFYNQDITVPDHARDRPTDDMKLSFSRRATHPLRDRIYGGLPERIANM